MHEEHRKRLRERFMKESLDDFPPHNVLELLLFYSIPRRDTNEIAHRLIDKFGTLSAVLEADANELLSVDGIGEQSAVLLSLIPQLSRRYMIDKQVGTGKVDHYKCAVEYFVPRFVGRKEETVYLMLLDSSYRLLNCSVVHTGSVNSAHLSFRCLIERALSCNATMAIIAHNHPDGIAIPSSADIETTRRLYDVFASVDVLLLEHFVISGERYASIIAKSLPSLMQYLTDDRRDFYAD